MILYMFMVNFRHVNSSLIFVDESGSDSDGAESTSSSYSSLSDFVFDIQNSDIVGETGMNPKTSLIGIICQG